MFSQCWEASIDDKRMEFMCKIFKWSSKVAPIVLIGNNLSNLSASKVVDKLKTNDIGV